MTIFKDIKKKRNSSSSFSKVKKPKFHFDRPTIVNPGIDKYEEQFIHRRIAMEALDISPDYNKSSNGLTEEQHAKVEEAIKEMQTKIPTGFMNDLYSMFYHDDEDIKLEALNSRSKEIKHKLLTKLYDTNSKLVTERNRLTSSFYTGSLLKALISVMEQEQQDLSDGEGGDCKNITDEQLEQLLNSKQLASAIDKAKSEANKKSEKVEENMKGMGMEEGTPSMEDIELYDLINKLNFSSNMVSTILAKILQLYSSTFSQKYDMSHIGLLDADEIDELEEIQYLHPIFRKIHLDDVVVEDRKYKGKIDIYIDSSGSMGGSNANSDLSKAKAIAIKLKLMGYVDQIHFFDTSLYTNCDTIKKVMGFSSGGGTTIDKPVKHARDNAKNAVVITDGGGNINFYYPGVVFIGIPGASFGYGFTDYVSNNRCY